MWRCLIAGATAASFDNHSIIIMFPSQRRAIVTQTLVAATEMPWRVLCQGEGSLLVVCEGRQKDEKWWRTCV
jgi:hypothetical protein